MERGGGGGGGGGGGELGKVVREKGRKKEGGSLQTVYICTMHMYMYMCRENTVHTFNPGTPILPSVPLRPGLPISPIKPFIP